MRPAALYFRPRATQLMYLRTGFNIEEMDKYFPIKNFDSVYLIDLCQPYVPPAKQPISIVHLRLRQTAGCRTPALRRARVEERAGALPGRHVLHAARMGRQPRACAGRRQVRVRPSACSSASNVRGSVCCSLFTLSYSLSMVPSYFALLDRIDEL